jgi:ligand-binding sensor domain-containing protein
MDNRFTVFKSFPGIIFLTSALLLFIELNIQGQANPVIKHLSRLDGLSNNRVVDITQDRTGFIWIATENGLNRYDGVEFKHYLNTNNKFNISKLFMDSSGNLWACSLGGRIYKYDYHSDTFVHINSKTELSGFSYISVIHEDADSTLWFGTDKGLYSYNPENGQTHHWISQDKNPNSLTNNNITDILEDNNGNLWISTYVGLNFFNTRATRFEAITANDRLSQLNGEPADLLRTFSCTSKPPTRVSGVEGVSSMSLNLVDLCDLGEHS